MIEMDTINKFSYPTLRTFKDALDLAQFALEKYAGVIPVADVAKRLGYTVNDPKRMSGTIYANINDLCMYGLFTKDVRGALKVTPLAREALDQGDITRAALAKARAIRTIDLIARAFDAWGGQIPDDTALPVKLSELTGADWTECKSKAESIKIVIKEAIPYLKLSKDAGESQPTPQPTVQVPQHTEEGREYMQKSEPSQSVPPSRPIGGIEEFVLGEGIRIYLPRENMKVAWEKAKKALKVLIEESNDA